MAQVTSGKIARCNWLLTWPYFPVKWPRASWKLWIPCERKQTQNKKIVIKKINYLPTELSDEEHSDTLSWRARNGREES